MLINNHSIKALSTSCNKVHHRWCPKYAHPLTSLRINSHLSPKVPKIVELFCGMDDVELINTN